ncbi:hypothetical protein LCGC14_1880530 [marine sediment metagenome]|uniref:NAD/GMP synthase domain-containing protein n=1 Tax=marine sediment metagenome TaxID=412755 RepID=A0A0F9GQN3_9ZZZZ
MGELNASGGDSLRRLEQDLRKLDSAVLALSGGLDSSFLLYALKEAGGRTLAITGDSPTTPARDLRDAECIAMELEVPHRFIETNEMEHEGFRENSPERCFLCKDVLFTQLTGIAKDEGYSAVLDGTTADDLKDHRPGLRAAKAHGVLSPLAECGMTKQVIREAARAANLSVSEKPASPCLSSRFSYGTRITPEGLKRVSKAEDYLIRLGLNEFRVRDTDGSARIEVSPGQMDMVFRMRKEIVSVFKGLGYRFVSLDLEGFASGKLNRVLIKDKKDKPEG